MQQPITYHLAVLQEPELPTEEELTDEDAHASLAADVEQVDVVPEASQAEAAAGTTVGPQRRPSSAAFASEDLAALRAEAAGAEGGSGSAQEGSDDEEGEDWAGQAADDKEEDEDEDIVAGWLEKAGDKGVFRSFKPRYIVLDNKHMCYYRDSALVVCTACLPNSPSCRTLPLHRTIL